MSDVVEKLATELLRQDNPRLFKDCPREKVWNLSDLWPSDAQKYREKAEAELRRRMRHV